MQRILCIIVAVFDDVIFIIICASNFLKPDGALILWFNMTLLQTACVCRYMPSAWRWWFSYWKQTSL